MLPQAGTVHPLRLDSGSRKKVFEQRPDCEEVGDAFFMGGPGKPRGAAEDVPTGKERRTYSGLVFFGKGNQGKGKVSGPQGSVLKMMLSVPLVPGRSLILFGRIGQERFPAPFGRSDVSVRGNADAGPHTKLKSPSLRKMMQENPKSLIHLFDRAVRLDIKVRPGQAIEEGVAFPRPVYGSRLFPPEIEGAGDRRSRAPDLVKHLLQTSALPFFREVSKRGVLMPRTTEPIPV